MEEVIKIEGGKLLEGNIKVSGAKNATVALIPACVLATDIVKIVGIPNISDVRSLKEILEAVVMAIGGFVIVAVILYFFPMKSLNQQMIEEILQTYPILSCLSAILFAPIVEETIFRMMIFTLIKNRWGALATSTILFAFAHTINLVTIIPYLVVGFIMGIAYMRHGLTSATLTHMIYNALGIFI